MNKKLVLFAAALAFAGCALAYPPTAGRPAGVAMSGAPGRGHAPGPAHHDWHHGHHHWAPPPPPPHGHFSR